MDTVEAIALGRRFGEEWAAIIAGARARAAAGANPTAAEEQYRERMGWLAVEMRGRGASPAAVAAFKSAAEVELGVGLNLHSLIGAERAAGDGVH